MKFNLSINISQGVSDNFNYIVTPNAQKVYGNIVDSFQSGIHSFLIIGTYGTGKSSFLMALEQDLLNNKSKLVSERSVFADAKSFEFMNIVGDYSSLSTLLSKELSIAPSDDSKNVFSTLTRYLIKLKDQNKFLFIFIDEFGKILEHAANNNPEKELYFLPASSSSFFSIRSSLSCISSNLSITFSVSSFLKKFRTASVIYTFSVGYISLSL